MATDQNHPRPAAPPPRPDARAQAGLPDSAGTRTGAEGAAGVTWVGAVPPDLPRPAIWQRLAGAVRALVLVLMTYALTPVHLLANRASPRAGMAVARAWARLNLALCGLRLTRRGAVMPEAGALVANHAGWIDIFTLLAAAPVHFVSKREVRDWPVVGRLSRQIDPVYIDRSRNATPANTALLRARLSAGARICLFPEGTSTDSRRVLPFKSSLFGVFYGPERHSSALVQPVSIIYRAPPTLPHSFFGWWGAMALGGHLWSVFTLSWGGAVEVVFHPPLSPADFDGRKALARACEDRVRAGVEAGLAREV